MWVWDVKESLIKTYIYPRGTHRSYIGEKEVGGKTTDNKKSSGGNVQGIFRR